MRIKILSQNQLKIIDQHINNKKVRFLTLFLTLIGCLSQLSHHIRDYLENDVSRELSKIPVDKFDLPDQTLCFQYVYLINLQKMRKVKPIVLEEVERFFRIKLDESIYFELIKKNFTFKEYFLRKLDEHVNYGELLQVIIKKSQIFERIEVSRNNRIGTLDRFEIHQYCLIKQLIKTFKVCYTFTCSTRQLNSIYDNTTNIRDDVTPKYVVDNFQKYRIQQSYLLSYMGKNIVFKIYLKKETFIKNQMDTLEIQLHEANTYPRRLKSLIHAQAINHAGFLQLYSYMFSRIKRLPAPYASNCSSKMVYHESRKCADRISKENMNSFVFGVYYPNDKLYYNWSLGLNLQYFYYKYNAKTFDQITKSCDTSIKNEICDEYIYYLFSNVPLPTDKMILQLMVPINANHLCQDRPKIELSELLLKCLSIINFWFGFTIIHLLFNLHNDIILLFKRTVGSNCVRKYKDCLFRGDEMAEDELKQITKYGHQIFRPGNQKINAKFDNKLVLRNGLNCLKNKLFKRRPKAKDEYLSNAHQFDSVKNREILYRNLRLNNWIYNPLTYSSKQSGDDLAHFNSTRNYLAYINNLNSLIDRPDRNLDKVVYKADNARDNKVSEKIGEKQDDKTIKSSRKSDDSKLNNKSTHETSDESNNDDLSKRPIERRRVRRAGDEETGTNNRIDEKSDNHETVFETINLNFSNRPSHQSNNESAIDSLDYRKVSSRIKESKK